MTFWLNQYLVHCRERQYRCAFSLVEIVIVVTILGVLAGVVVPHYSSFIANQHLEAAVRKIKLDLSYAQNSAKVSSQARSVDFAVVNNEYQIVGESDLNRSASPYQVTLSKPPYNAQLVSVNFNSTTKVTYDGYGVPDNNGTIVVRVGNIQETIYVNKPDSVVLPGAEK